MIMTELDRALASELMKTIDLTNGENSQCNTYDMGAKISVDKR